MLSLSFALALAIQAQSQPKHFIHADTLGRKAGVLELLYSKDGPAEYGSFIDRRLTAVGDAAYLILEAPGFTRVMIASAGRRPDGSLQARGDSYVRSTSGGARCSPAAMEAMDVAGRVNHCYHQPSEYRSDEGQTTVARSGREFAEFALRASEELVPTVPIREFLEKAGMKSKYEEFLDVYRTMKLQFELALALIHQGGWRKDLTEPGGWSRTGGPTPAEKKLLAGVRRLMTDGKVFLSNNVRCAAKAAGPIVDRAPLKRDECRPSTFMGETFAEFFGALESAGYRYDAESDEWKR